MHPDHALVEFLGVSVRRGRHISVDPAGSGSRVTYGARLVFKGLSRLADPVMQLVFNRVGRKADASLRLQLNRSR